MRTTADIAGVKPFITGILYLNNGATKVITNVDLKADTFTIESGTSNTNEFTVGACVIGGLNFTLLNNTGKFSDLDWYNSKVAIKLSYDDDVELDYDDYFVVKHHEIGKLINVECYDALKVLDEYNLYELTQNYGLSFPCSVHQVLTALSTQHGFTFTGCTGINIQLEDPNNDQMTQRALLAYIAQLCGQYVKAYGTELRFGWYDMINATHVGTTFSHDLRTDDITITGVKLTTYDDEDTVELGSGNNPIEIDDNPFITKNNINTVASAIYSAIGRGTFTYRPGDVSIISNAAIEAGDVLLVNTGEEKNIKVLATNITYKPQLQESISSDADPYAGDLRINRSEYIKKQAEKAAEKVSEKVAEKVAQDTISDELKNPESELSHAISGGGGASMTVITVTNRAGESEIDYTLGGHGSGTYTFGSFKKSSGKIQPKINELYHGLAIVTGYATDTSRKKFIVPAYSDEARNAPFTFNLPMFTVHFLFINSDFPEGEPEYRYVSGGYVPCLASYTNADLLVLHPIGNYRSMVNTDSTSVAILDVSIAVTRGKPGSWLMMRQSDGTWTINPTSPV